MRDFNDKINGFWSFRRSLTEELVSRDPVSINTDIIRIVNKTMRIRYDDSTPKIINWAWKSKETRRSIKAD